MLPVAEAVRRLGVGELKEQRQLWDDNERLKGVVADLSLDKTILRDALGEQL